MFRSIFTLLFVLFSFISVAQTKPSKEYLTHLNAAKKHIEIRAVGKTR